MLSVPVPILSPTRVRRVLAVLCAAVLFAVTTPDAAANLVKFTVKRASNRSADFGYGVPGSPNQQQSVEEGNTTITFRIYLDVAPANGSASVQWTTVDSTSDPAFKFLQRGSDYAVPNVDYVPASGTVTINQNDATRFRDITVTLLPDPNPSSPSPEFNKDIFVRLLINGSSPSTSSTMDAASVSLVGGVETLSASGPYALAQVDGNLASVTILDSDQPGGALDRAWNLDNNFFTVPPYNPLPGANDTVNAVAIDPVGVAGDQPRTIIGGDFTAYNTSPINRIARINFDGSIDTTFNPGLGANNFVSAIAVYTSNSSTNLGTIIVGGGFTSFNGTSRNGIARLTSTGALDLAFDPGAGFNGPVRSVVIQPDDKIVVGGQFTLFNGVSRTNVARLNADGTLDGSFNPGSGLGADGVVYSVALQGNPPPIPIPTVNSGNLPNTNVISVGATAGTLTITANMYRVANTLKIYYGDRLNNPANAVLMLNTNFGNDQVLTFNVPFGPGVLGVGGASGGPFSTVTITIDEGQANSTRWQYNGSISTVAAGPELVIGGDFTTVGGVARSRIALLRQDGTLDTGFDPGTGADNTVFAIAVQANGSVLLGGAFSTVNVSSRNGIARLNTDGSLDTTFNPGTGTTNAIAGSVDRISGIVLDSSSRAVIVGSFTTFNGTVRMNVARLLTTGALDTSFMDLAYNQNAGPFNSTLGSGVTDFYGIGIPFSTPWLLTPIAAPPATFLNAVAVQSDGNILVGGNFTDFGAAASITFNTAPWDAGRSTSFPFGPGGSSAIFNNHIPVDLTPANLRILRMNQTKPRQNVARLIGRSTAGSGNLDFISATYSVTEGQPTAFVKLQRSNGNLGPANVAFATSDGTAIATSDYTANAGTVKWNSQWSGSVGSGTRQLWDSETGVQPAVNNSIISISILNNFVLEPDETVHIDLSTVAGNTFLGDGGNGGNGKTTGLAVPLSPAFGFQKSALLTIVDDDFSAGTFNFSSATYSVLENAGSATITVTRTGGSVGLVTVKYASSVPGAFAATPGSDYTAVSGTLTFLTGETNKTFIVPILNDAIVEQDELVTLTLSNPSGGASIGAINPATLTIIDDDYNPGRLSLSSAAYTVVENAGYIDVTVTRTGGSVGASAVVFKTTDNTALTGVDYTGTTNLLTWGNGDATIRTIRIPIINNQLVDGSRKFKVDLDQTTLTNSLLPGLNFTGFVTITDDDNYGSVQFVSSNYSVTENGGVATITVVRTGGSGGTVTVNFLATPGTATTPADYTNPGAVLLTMPPGVTSATVNIPIIDNATVGPPTKSLSLNLATARGNGVVVVPIIGSNPATLTIVDDESFNITAGSLDALFTLGDGPNDVVQTVALDSNNKILIGGDFTQFNHVARNRLARLNSDGTLDTAFLSTQAGANATVRKILVQPNGQILVAGAFTTINNTNLHYLARLNVDGSVDSSFNPGTGADNPVTALALQSDGKIIAVGDFATFNGGQANFIVRLDINGVVDTTFSTGTGADGSIAAVALQPDGKILVGGEFTTINGATNANRIARLNTDGSVDSTFFSGVATNGANDNIRTIALQSDGKIVIGGLFTSVNGVANNRYARLLNNGTQDGQLDATFTVNGGAGANDVVNAIAIQPDGKIVLVGDFTTCNGVTRNRITRLQSDGLVDPTINFGSGANNVINAALIQPANGMIVIGGGFTSYDGVPINYLARLNGGSLGGAGRLEFTAANYLVDENGGSALITVRRIGGTAGTVTANYQTTDITAISGVHYAGFPSGTDVLTFPNGETLKTFTITVTNDNVVNIDRTVNLALFNFSPVVLPPPGVAGNQTNAVLTIVNDDGVLGFAAAAYSVNENVVGGFATITVTRTGGTTAPASVRYATSDGTATASGANPDYTAVSGTLNFAAGQSIATFLVPIVQDGLVEGDETVNLTLSNLTGAVTPGILNATLMIVDDDFAPGDLQFSSATYGVDEAGVSVVITVVRTTGSLGRVAVNFTTGNGTAIAPTDYNTTNGNLSFANGQTSRTFTVKININPASTNNTTVNLSLNTPTGGASLGGQSTAVLTITNNDFIFGNFVFSSPTFTANENITPGLVTVKRIGGSVGAVSVSYAITNGTAIAGRDYTNLVNPYVGTLSWADTDATDKTFNIDIVNNVLIDGDRTVNLRLFNPTGRASLGAQNTAVLTILDDETGPGQFNFTTSGFTVAENGTNAVISITRTVGHTGAVSVDFITSPGTAIPVTDYTPPAFVTLNFADGQTSTNILIPIIDNFVVGGNKIVNLTLNTPTGGASLGSPSTATLTIIDNDPPAGSLDDTFTPGGGANAPIHALGRQSNGQLVVGGEFTAYDGLSRTNVALLLATGVLDTNFNAGQVRLGAVAGSIRTLGVQSDDKVVIGGLFDTVNGINRNYLARLNTNGAVDLTFNPGGGANNPVYALAVQNNGRIVAGGSFTAFNGATRNFIVRLLADGSVDPSFAPPLGPDSIVRAVAVDTIGRVLIAGDFQLVDGVTRRYVARLLSNGSLDATFDPGANLDGSVRSIALQTDGKVIIGGLFNNYGATSRKFVARLNADGSLDASFNPATGADDYVNSVVLQPDGKVIVGGGFTLFNGLSRNGIARLTTLGAIDPSMNFGSGANDDVDALLVQPNGSIVLGGWFTLYDGVTNNYIARVNGGTNLGAGIFGFSAANYSVNENGGSLTLTVTRTGGTSNTVTLDFATLLTGTAVAGTHYIAIPTSTLTFLEGETSRTFALQILDDFPAATNVNRTLDLGLSNLAGPGNPSFGQTTTRVTILDNESVIGFSAATYNVVENAGPAVITVTRVGGTNDAVSVVFYTTDGTALSPGRYLGVTNTVNFAPGQTTTNLLLTIPDNLVVNGDETVLLTLANYTGSALRGLTNATLNIIDNEFGPGTFSFSASAYSANETTGGTTATITVRRTNGQQGPASVNYATRNGTALSGVHYTATSGLLTWADGDNTPKTFTVTILNNATVDGPRTVNLALSNPSAPATLGTPSTAVLTIFDNDTGLQFSQAAYTVLENAGFATINVYRPDALAGTVSVTYTASAGTATAGQDFTPVSGLLTFGPGVTNRTFVVPILGNPLGYTNTTVLLALSAPTGGATVSATQGTAVLTIIDVAAGAVDLSFGATLGANGAVYSLAFMTNGQVVLGGDFTAVNSVPVNRVARLNSNGTTDLGFNSGSGANNTVYAVAVQPNNNAVILGGSFTTVGGFNQGRIARLTSTGATDFSFNFGGSGADNTVYAVGIDTNNFILIGGAFTNVNGTARGGIARLTTLGAVDGTFNPSTGANGTVRALDIDGFNRIVIGGDFTTVNGTSRTRIARLNSDGTLDATFNPGLGADATIYSVKVTPTGRILVAGAFTTFNGSTKYGITQLNANGSIDAGFNAGIGANGVITALEIDTNGRILVVGDFTTFNGSSRVRYARLNSDGSLDGNFDPGSGANAIVNAVTVLRQPAPATINLGVGANGAGTQTDVFNTGSTAGTLTINYDMFFQADEMRVYYGDRINDPANTVLLFNTGTVSGTGTFTVPYGPGASTFISVAMNEIVPVPGTIWNYTITIVPNATPGLVPDRIVIGGDFTTVDGTPRDRFAEINNDGSLNTTYGMGASLPVVLALGINNNPALPTLFGKTVAGGNFSVINGVNANNIVRLNLDGSVDLNFNPGTGANGQVNTLAVQTDGKVIIGGYFTSVNGTARNYIARLNSNGSLDATFDPGVGANNPVFSVALQPNGKILVGGLFTSYNTTARNFLTRLNSDGTVDATFNPSQGPSDVVRAIAVQTDGKIVIGGDFFSYDGQSRSRLARLTSTGALDPGFDASAGTDNFISTVKIDASGNIVVGGSFTLAQDSVNLMNWNGIARFTSSGSLDVVGFNPGIGFNDNVSSIALEPGGNLVVAGAFTSFDGIAENRIVRLNNDGSLDTTINFGSGANNYISAAQLQNDGKIVIGGAFTSVDGVPRTAIARLNGGANTSGFGVFEFSTSNYTASENGTFATITVNRRGVLTGPAFVDFSTSDGTAIAYPGVGPTTGFNYTNTSLTLNFEGGQSSTNFTLGLIDDGATNVDRTVVLKLSNPSLGAGLGNLNTSTLTIVDDDSVLNFSALSYSVVENGVQARITVNRLGGVAGGVSVQYATRDGTALAYPGAGPVAGFDYTNSFGTLTWTAGDRSPKTFTVGIIDNLTTNGNRSLNLSLFNALNLSPIPQTPSAIPLVLSGTTNATLTIVDNEFGPGVLGLATNAFYVAEGNNPTNTAYTFNVVRASGNTGPVRVNYTTVNGTATAGLDYVATSGQLSFANGETVKPITVTVLGDSIVEGNEAFGLVLSSPTGGATLGLSAATVNIVDDDGVVQFSSASYSVSEGAGWATITVTKTPVTSGTIRVNFATSNGSATAGADYTATNGTLIFGPSVNSLSFTVPITEDVLTEGSETVNLRLSNLVGLGFLGPLTNAVLTILDNDTGLQFSSATYSVAESGGAATITVVRTGDTNSAVGVTYSTSNGSATSGADYTAQNGTLAFGPGVTSQSFTVPIVEDALVEGNETVNLRLTLPTNGALLSVPNTAVLTIVDNDQSFEFTAANYTVLENGGNASITVRRNGVTTSAASVTVSTSDGSATAPADYTARVGVVLNFGVGVTSQTLTVPIINDALPEGDETVNLTLSNPSGGALLGATNTAVLTILDNDIVVQFTAATFSFSEGSSNGLIVVQRQGSTNNASTVTLTTAAGTATAGVDYVNVTTNLTFAPGVTNLTVAVPFFEDSALEPDETITLTLSNPSAGVTLGGQSAAVLRLVDNDRVGSLDSTFDPGFGADGIVSAIAVQADGKVLIGGGFTSVNGTSRLGIARLNADGTLDLSFDSGTGVNGPVYAVAVDSQGRVVIGGIFTAVNGQAYTNVCRLLSDGSVDIANFSDPGINANGAVTAIVVDGNDDILVAGDFSDIGGIGRNRIARLSGTGGSLDLSFDPGTGANAMVNAVTLDLTGNVLVGGFFNSFDGMARAGVARLLSDGTLDTSFDPAISAGSVIYSLAVQPADGYVVLGGDFNTVNGIGRTNVARLIVDGINDGLVDLGFDPGAGVNSIVRSLAIDLSGHVLIGGDFTMVNNTNRNGIARLGTDGSLDPDLAVSTTGSFDPGIGAGGPVYAVVAQSDGKALVGGDFATMDGVSRGGIARLNGNQGVLQFSAPIYLVNEDTLGGAVVTVIRTGGSSGTIMVNYLTADGSATTNGPAADYTRTAGTLVFPPGVTSTNIIIPLNADTTVETNEDFTITLSNPTGASILGSPATATVTIVNDDVRFSFTSATYSVVETGVFAPVIVTRSGNLTATVSVDLTTAGGTAISTAGPNQDYTDASQTLVFLPNQASQTVFILINDDQAAEGDETVNLTLSAATNPTGGASLVAPSTATLTIVDNDVEFNFSTATYFVGEGGTNAIVTVTRRGDTNAVASVFFTTSDLSPAPGAATAGADYTAVARTLNFASGQVSANVLVPITPDSLAEGNEVINLALSGEDINPNPTGGFASSGRRTATLTILDDDVGFSFSSPNFTVNENASPAVITIVRTGDTSQAASVDFSTSNGSATAGLDYAARVNVRVDFAPFQTTRTLNITIVNDSLPEGDETVNLTLSGGINPVGAVNLGPPAVLTIVDNDVGFGFVSANLSVSEGAGRATITVTRFGDTNASASVSFTTSDGTATLAGGDYTGTNGTLIFAPTEVSKTFTVPINNDSLVEGDEFLNLTLSNPTNPTGSTGLGQKTATLTIVDNDVGFSFSSATFSVVESQPTATITIIRTGDTNSLATVTFATTNGTATSGLDYIGQTNTITFLPFEVSQNISIPIINDLFAEGNETVFLGLSAPATADSSGTASLGSIPSATLTIIDDDFVTIAASSYVLTAESFSPANNGIDQNELVTVGFALRNDGNVPTANLTAQLLSTGGVTSPSPSTAVSYGALLPSGPPKTNSFTFTATAAQVINATFQLQDGTTNLGTVTFSIQMGSLATFTNRTRLNVPGSLTIPSMGPASLYPSPIVVSNVNGVVNKVMVTLNQLNHPFPDDLNMLLVSPTGQKVLLMANAGGNFGLVNVTLTLDDAAALPLPDAGQIIAGGYKPANYPPANVFPAPAPAGPYATVLSACNGFDPNGNWSLYVFDDTFGDNGFIQSGWTLTLYTVNPTIDLAATLTSTPNPVTLGNRVTYSTTITNKGPFIATGVMVTNTLPAGATFVSASSPQGTCTFVGGKVVCNVGNMTNGASVTVTIVVTPTLPGVNASSAIVTASQIELNPADNSVAATTQVNGAALSSAPSKEMFSLTLQGQNSKVYVIEASSDLTVWVPISTNTVVNGIVAFTDQGATNYTRRFYRAIER